MGCTITCSKCEGTDVRANGCCRVPYTCTDCGLLKSTQVRIKIN